jgi:hypothetical protein
MFTNEKSRVNRPSAPLSIFSEYIQWEKMLMARTFEAVLLLISLVLPFHCLAYQDSMSIAEIDLRLGMPKEKVIDMFLAKDYRVVPSGDIYTISKRQGESYDGLGAVGFKSQKLSFISSRWYHTYKDIGGFELANKILELLRQEAQDGKPISSVIALTSSDHPSYKTDSVNITIDNKTIELSIIKGDEEYGHQIAIFKSIRSK